MGEKNQPATRRSHRKSRAGCSDCKRRHLKCDEHRPKCVNCQTAGLSCSYKSDIVKRPEIHISPVEMNDATPSSQLSQDANLDANLPTFTRTTSSPPTPFSPSTLDDNVALNMDHLELLHQYQTRTYLTMAHKPAQQEMWRITGVETAFRNPFLMYAILALAALHLGATATRDRRAYFRAQSVQLHGSALRSFNAALPNVNETNFGPALLFAGLVSIQFIGDVTQSAHRTLGIYLENMVKLAKLALGGKVIVLTWWTHVKSSDVAPLIDVGLHELDDMTGVPEEVKVLSNLISAEDERAENIYRPAIRELYRIYGSFCRKVDPCQFMGLWSWLVLIPQEFYQATEERRPEALIILAYYAALLHTRRWHWAVGDAGSVLVKAINDHLGTYWETYMSWPLKVISGNVFTAITNQEQMTEPD